MNTNTPCSLGLPQTLRQRIRERAEQERRSFADTVRVLLERQLDASPPEPRIDPDEVERLALVAQEALADYAIGGCEHATGVCTTRTFAAPLTQPTRATKRFWLGCAGLDGPGWA